MRNLNPACGISANGSSAVADLAQQQRLCLLSPRKWFRDSFEVSTDSSLLNHKLIFQWLSEFTPDARRLALALSTSLCFGLYRSGRQIGFARVVTDMAETTVVRDLYITQEYRFIGLGSWLLNCCISHPATRGCHTLICLSKSSPEFLEKCGFRSHALIPDVFGRDAGHAGYAESGLTDHLLRQ